MQLCCGRERSWNPCSDPMLLVFACHLKDSEGKGVSGPASWRGGLCRKRLSWSEAVGSVLTLEEHWMANYELTTLQLEYQVPSR